MMCAFMTPVLKNDWEVYQSKNTRRNGADSPQKTGSHQRTESGNLRRKVLTSESRSMSYAGHNQRTMSEFAFQRGPPRSYHLSTRNSRNASRASFSPQDSGLNSPTKTHSSISTGPKKSPSSSSLSRFHNKVMDKLRSALHFKDQDNDSKASEDEEESSSSQRSQP